MIGWAHIWYPSQFRVQLQRHILGKLGFIDGGISGLKMWVSKGMMYLLWFSLYSKSSNQLQGLVYNLKDEIEKSTLTNFGNNVKKLLDDMSSNCFIIIDGVECHEDYVRYIFRALLSGPNSTFNNFIWSTKDDWDTGREVTAGELIQNDTEKYNNMASEK